MTDKLQKILNDAVFPYNLFWPDLFLSCLSTEAFCCKLNPEYLDKGIFQADKAPVVLIGSSKYDNNYNVIFESRFPVKAELSIVTDGCLAVRAFPDKGEFLIISSNKLDDLKKAKMLNSTKIGSASLKDAGRLVDSLVKRNDLKKDNYNVFLSYCVEDSDEDGNEMDSLTI